MIGKLLIAVPCYEDIKQLFAESLNKLKRKLEDQEIPFEEKMTRGTMVHKARDDLARFAISGGFTHVLWIDSDMVFEADALERLYETGKDIVCGLYVSRHDPYPPVIFKAIEPRVIWHDRWERELFRVAGCGFGLVLMKAEVLPQVMNANEGKCFLPTKDLGEDLAFCQRAQQLGYEIWCEPKVRCGHIGQAVFRPAEGNRGWMIQN